MTTVAATLDKAHVYNDLSGLHALRSAEGTEAEKIQATAKQFESMMVNLMLKSMRKANDVFAEGNILNTNSTKFYQDMLDQQLSLTMTRNDGLGLAEMLASQLTQRDAKSQPGQHQTLADYTRRGFEIIESAGSSGSADRRSTDSIESMELFSDSQHDLAAEPVSLLLSAQETEVLTDVENLLSDLFSDTDRASPYERRANAEQRLVQDDQTDPHLFASDKDLLAKEVLAAENLPEVAATPITEPLVFNNPREFIATLFPAAQRVAVELGVDAKLLLAQAALETGWGKHMINDGQQPSFNLFGIKADSRWQGDSAEVTTTEYRQGIKLKEQAAFRSYHSYDESFRDYMQFLQDNSRYQSALASRTEPKDFVHALQKAGYATDPEYANKIMQIYQGMADHPVLQQRSAASEIASARDDNRG